jgi:hypothetical protein
MQNLSPLLSRIATALVALVILLYLGDYLVVRMRSEPTGTCEITKLYAVPQKDGKTSYEAGEPELQTCANSIFPHLGYNPCWYVKRHKTQQVNL